MKEEWRERKMKKKSVGVTLPSSPPPFPYMREGDLSFSMSRRERSRNCPICFLPQKGGKEEEEEGLKIMTY